MPARVVQDNSQAVIARILAGSIALLDGAGDVAEQVADVLVPVDTGALKASRLRVGRGTALQSISYGGPDTYYAQFVEFGTYKMTAQPFLMPGFYAAAAFIKRSTRP